MTVKIKVHISDFFNVSPKTIKDYGAFNISLVNDVPLFVDPFLLFNSKETTYQELHTEIIKYLRFLRENSVEAGIKPGLLKNWFYFSEVKQTWLGYSKVGNNGRGLGRNFGKTLYQNLNRIFSQFGAEEVTQGSHLEKLCLINPGIGRDLISDFTTNLIKKFLLEYTQTFAEKYVDLKFRNDAVVDRVYFNYETRSWVSAKYNLPFYAGNYVLLMPKDILTHDDTWINKADLTNPDTFNEFAASLPNEQLRAQVEQYLLKVLTPIEGKVTKERKQRAIKHLISEYPELIDYYISYKEDRGDDAVAISEEQVETIETIFVKEVENLVARLVQDTAFYQTPSNTYTETRQRIMFLKDVIENKGGHRIFHAGKKPIRRENDLQIMFRLVWFASVSNVSREVNNGRGPVDFEVSQGSNDKTLAEFKLASNSQLKRNLERQTAIYQKASDADKAIKVIVYFSADELQRVQNILRELELASDPDIILIDARADNKPSGSKA